MSGTSDHRPGDHLDDLLDDETIDALVTGEPADARLGELAAFAREARTLGEGPPPRPSPSLAAFISQGGAAAERTTPAAPASRPGRRRMASVAAAVAGLGAVAKVALGASVAVAGVAAAGAAGVLPGPADRQVRQVIEATTPIDFREPDDDRPTHDRPTTTDSHADDDGVPTSEAPGSTSDGGEAPGEPGRSRGRQDPATERGERGRREEGSGGQGRNSEQPGGQGGNAEQPGEQGGNHGQPGGQGRNPEQPSEPGRRPPTETTTTTSANRTPGADPPGQDQGRRAPGNSSDTRPERSE